MDLIQVQVDIEVFENNGVFEVELVGDDREIFVQREGHLLHTLDYLIPRLVRGMIGRGVPCKVDFDGFRTSHEISLRRLAKRTAEEVLRRGREKRLEPMNPADRRIVHMEIADDPDVLTESEGDGFYKRVVVFLADGDDEDYEDDIEEEEEKEEERPRRRHYARNVYDSV